MKTAAVTALAAGVTLLATACGSDPSPEETVRAWTDAVARIDNSAAAELFAEGAVVVQGGVPLLLPTRDDAVLWLEHLPCSARIADVVAGEDGELTVTFRLADRGTTPCDGPGQSVVVDIIVRDSKITQFRQRGAAPGVASLE